MMIEIATTHYVQKFRHRDARDETTDGRKRGKTLKDEKVRTKKGFV